MVNSPRAPHPPQPLPSDPSITGQQHHQVGNFLRVGEAAGRRVSDGLLGDLVGMAVGGPSDGSGDSVVPEPQIGLDRQGLTVFTRTPCGPNSLDTDLQKLVSAPLAAL